MFSPCINYWSPGFNVLCNCSNRAVYTFIMGHCGGDVYTYIVRESGRGFQCEQKWLYKCVHGKCYRPAIDQIGI